MSWDSLIGAIWTLTCYILGVVVTNKKRDKECKICYDNLPHISLTTTIDNRNKEEVN